MAETIGDRLARIRGYRRLSQQDVADLTGLKVQNISRLETDGRERVRSLMPLRDDATPGGSSSERRNWRGVMERPRHDGRERREQQANRRRPTADRRRILVVGPDDSWRLLTAYVFEEAGYAVFSAADACQALGTTPRLLPNRPDAVTSHCPTAEPAGHVPTFN